MLNLEGLFLFCIYLVSCVSMGLLFSRAFSLEKAWEKSPLSGLGMTFLMGTGLNACLWMILGSFTLRQKPIAMVSAITVVLAAKPLKELLINIAEELVSFLKKLKATHLFVLFMVFFVLGHFAYYATRGFFFGPSHDALAFYLAYPKYIAYAEQIVPFLSRAYFTAAKDYGLAAEINYALTYVLGGYIGLSKAFVSFLGLSAALSLVGVCRNLGLKLLGTSVAIIALYSSTVFTEYMTDGKTDCFPAALLVPAMQVFSVFFNDRKKRYLVAMGIICGTSVLGKFPYLASITPAFVIMLLFSRESSSSIRSLFNKNSFKELLIFGGSFFFALFPQSIKNVFVFNELSLPFFKVIFGDSNIKAPVWISAPDSVKLFFTSPFALSWGDYPYQGGHLSFLPLLFVPIFLMTPKSGFLKRNAINIFFWGSTIGFLTWMLLMPRSFMPRFFFGVLILMLPVAGKGAEILFHEKSFLYWKKALASLGILAALSASYIHLNKKMPTELFFGLYKSYKIFPEDHGEVFDPCRLAEQHMCKPVSYLNKVVPKGARLYGGMLDSFWLRPDLLFCKNTAAEIAETEKEPWGFLYKNGFSHILFDLKAIQPFEVKNIPSWLQVSEIKLPEHGISPEKKIAVFEIKSNDDSKKPQKTCAHVKGQHYVVK